MLHEGAGISSLDLKKALSSITLDEHQLAGTVCRNTTWFAIEQQIARLIATVCRGCGESGWFAISIRTAVVAGVAG